MTFWMDERFRYLMRLFAEVSMVIVFVMVIVMVLWVFKVEVEDDRAGEEDE